MKQGKWAEVAGFGGALAEHNFRRNICYDTNEAYYVITWFTGTSVVIGYVPVAGGNWASTFAVNVNFAASNNCVCRSYDNQNTYAAWSYNIAALDYKIRVIYGNIHTSTWVQPAEYDVTNSSKIIDIFKLGATYYLMIAESTTVRIFSIGAVNLTLVDSEITLDDAQSVYAGSANYGLTEYYFLMYKNDNKLYRCVFDGASIVATEITPTGWVAPASWNVEYQQYWEFYSYNTTLMTKLLFDKERFLVYDKLKTDWVVKATSGVYGTCWNYNLKSIMNVFWDEVGVGTHIYHLWKNGGCTEQLVTDHFEGLGIVLSLDSKIMFFYDIGGGHTYSYSKSIYVADSGVVHTKYKESRTVQLSTSETITNNECKYFYDDSSNLAIICWIKSNPDASMDPTPQASGEELSKQDLDRPVEIVGTYTWTNAIKYLIRTYCLFLWYDTLIDTVAGDHVFAFRGTFRQFVFQYADMANSRRFHWFPSLECAWTVGTTDTGIDVLEGTHMCNNLRDDPLTSAFGRVEVEGMDTDGQPITSYYQVDPQYPTFFLKLPMLSTTAEVLAVATALGPLLNINAHCYSFQTHGKAPIQVGQQITLSASMVITIGSAQYYVFESAIDLVTLLQDVKVHNVFYPFPPKEGSVNPQMLYEAVQAVANVSLTKTDTITTNLTTLLTKLTYAFAATTNTATAMVNNANTLVPFEDEEYDPASVYNVNGTFTAPVAGVWHFDALITLASSANWEKNEQAEIKLYKAGVLVRMGQAHFFEAAGTFYCVLHISTDIKLTATQTVQVYVYQNSDANIGIYNDGTYNHFVGHWVSDG